MPPGEILVQMSDTQRHLNSDLEVVVSPRPHSLEGSLGRVGCVLWGMRASTPFLREDFGDMTTAAALLGTCQGPALLGTFTCTSCSSSSNLGGRCHFYPHLTEEETESQGSSHSPKIPE